MVSADPKYKVNIPGFNPPSTSKPNSKIITNDSKYVVKDPTGQIQEKGTLVNTIPTKPSTTPKSPKYVVTRSSSKSSSRRSSNTNNNPDVTTPAPTTENIKLNPAEKRQLAINQRNDELNSKYEETKTEKGYIFTGAYTGNLTRSNAESRSAYSERINREVQLEAQREAQRLANQRPGQEVSVNLNYMESPYLNIPRQKSPQTLGSNDMRKEPEFVVNVIDKFKDESTKPKYNIAKSPEFVVKVKQEPVNIKPIGMISALPKEKGLSRLRTNLFRTTQKLENTPSTSFLDQSKKSASLIGLNVASAGVGFLTAGKDFAVSSYRIVTNPVKNFVAPVVSFGTSLVKNPKSTLVDTRDYIYGERMKLGDSLRINPGYTIGKVTGDIVFARGSTRAFKGLTDVTKNLVVSRGSYIGRVGKFDLKLFNSKREVPVGDVFDESSLTRPGGAYTSSKGLDESLSEFNRAPFVQTSGPASLKGEVAGVGRKASLGLEDPGIYVNPLGRGGAAPLGVGADASSGISFNPVSFVQSLRGTPTVTIFKTQGVMRYPRSVINQPGFQDLAKFQESISGSGKVIITKRSELAFGSVKPQTYNNAPLGKQLLETGSSELEAVIPVSSKFVQGTAPNKFTLFGGRAVRIRSAEIINDGVSVGSDVKVISGSQILGESKAVSSIGGSSKRFVNPLSGFSTKSTVSSESFKLELGNSSFNSNLNRSVTSSFSASVPVSNPVSSGGSSNNVSRGGSNRSSNNSSSRSNRVVSYPISVPVSKPVSGGGSSSNTGGSSGRSSNSSGSGFGSSSYFGSGSSFSPPVTSLSNFKPKSIKQNRSKSILINFSGRLRPVKTAFAGSDFIIAPGRKTWGNVVGLRKGVEFKVEPKKKGKKSLFENISFKGVFS